MKEIKVTKSGQLTNYATFETYQEVMEWLVHHEALGTFGDVGTYVIETNDITAQVEQGKLNAEALTFLMNTDYKVMKYRDQMDMGETPDLSVEEFQSLLTERQQARDAIIKIE